MHENNFLIYQIELMNVYRITVSFYRISLSYFLKTLFYSEMYVSYFKNTCSLYIVTSLKYTYYDITIEIKNQPQKHIKMRHKRYVCKEVQPFLLQKMETIRQIRIEFEKYLLNIDPYKAIKQVCTCTLTPSTHPTPYPYM